MKTAVKISLAVFAASIIGTAAAMADSAVVRVDHANGQPTFIYGPQSNGPVATVSGDWSGRQATATIGVYSNGRSVGDDSTSITRLDHSNGRPTFIYAPQANGPVGVR